MRAGSLRDRCTLWRLTSEPDGYGGQKKSQWVEFGQIWAAVALPTGRVAPVANQVVGLITAEIQVRYRASIKSGLRISDGHTTYLIEAALPDGKKTMLRLLCSNVPIT